MKCAWLLPLLLGLWGQPAWAAPPLVQMVAVGDVAFRGRVGKAVAEGTADPFAAVRQRLMADLRFANLETVLTLRKLPDPASSRQFPIIRSPPQSAKLLAQVGFDVVSVANNHAFDFYAPGFLDTLSHLAAARVTAIGAGRTAKDAAAPFVKTVNGVRIGMLAFASGVNRAAHGNAVVARRYDEGVRKSISALRSQVDVLLVSVHFGLEGQMYPNQKQTDFAHAVIMAGADVVIGHHPHVLQSVEVYRGRPIFYSLGNFVFGKQPKVRRQTAILHLALGTGPQPLRAVSLSPILIREETELPDLPTAAEAEEIFARIRKASRPFRVRLEEREGRLEILGDWVSVPSS